MQVKRALKDILFFVTNKKGDFNLQYKCVTSPHPLFQNQRPLILYRILFQRIFIQVRINKMINEHSVDYKTSSSGLTLKYIVSCFYRLLGALFLLRIFVGFSLKPEYSIMVGENFQIYVIITGKCIYEPKIRIYKFLLMVPARQNLPCSNLHLQGRGKLLNPRWQLFLSSQFQQKGGTMTGFDLRVVIRDSRRGFEFS